MQEIFLPLGSTIFVPFMLLLWLRTCDVISPPRVYSKLIWALPIHVSATFFDVYALVYLVAPSLLDDMDLFTFAYSHDASTMAQETNENLRAYYYVNIGIWWSVVLEFITNKTDTEEDKPVKLIHHIATLTSLFVSNMYGYRLIGLLILFVHDVVDIALICLKIAIKRKAKSLILAVLYVLLVFTWGFFRIYVFGYQLCYIELWTYALNGNVVETTCVLALFALALCHVYWFGLLIRAPFRSKLQDAAEVYEQSNKSGS